MKITHAIDLDMRNMGNRRVLEVKQGDSLSRELVISLFDNGVAWDIPKDADVLRSPTANRIGRARSTTNCRMEPMPVQRKGMSSQHSFIRKCSPLVVL